MKARTVANIAYEACRVLAMEEFNDMHHRRWRNLDGAHQQALIDGVLFHFVNPQIGPEAAHYARCKKLLEKGWTFGPEKDVEKKLSPILVPYEQLSADRQYKYFIFASIAGNLAQFIEDGPEAPKLEVMPSDPLGLGVHLGVGGAAPQGEQAASTSSEDSGNSSDTTPSPTPSPQVVTPEEIDVAEKDTKKPSDPTSTDTASPSSGTESASTPSTSTSQPTVEDSAATEVQMPADVAAE